MTRLPNQTLMDGYIGKYANHEKYAIYAKDATCKPNLFHHVSFSDEVRVCFDTGLSVMKYPALPKHHCAHFEFIDNDRF